MRHENFSFLKQMEISKENILIDVRGLFLIPAHPTLDGQRKQGIQGTKARENVNGFDVDLRFYAQLLSWVENKEREGAKSKKWNEDVIE